MQDMTTKQSNLTVPTEPEQASSQFLIGLMIFKCISIVVGVLGNFGVIIYNVFMNKEKSPTTWLIVNLSVTDLLVCTPMFLHHKEGIRMAEVSLVLVFYS